MADDPHPCATCPQYHLGDLCELCPDNTELSDEEYSLFHFGGYCCPDS